MKNKDLEKLINDIDVDVDFNKINSKINYSKYQKVPEKKSVFKFRYALVSLLALLVVSFAGNSLYVNLYNNNLDRKIEKMLNDSIKLEKIENDSDYQKALSNNNLVFDGERKVSWIEQIVEDVEPPKGERPTGSSDMIYEGNTSDEPQTKPNQTETNVQVKGIDEADVSKCDGEYIYAAYKKNLVIYNLEGNKIVNESLEVNKGRNNLYVQDDYVILLNTFYTRIYEFKNETLTILEDIKYSSIMDSRLEGNDLYLVVNDFLLDELEQNENLYYACGVKTTNKYSIYKYNLEEKELEKTSNLNAGSVRLYMSSNHIYLATLCRYYVKDCGYRLITITSIFNKELEPVGAVKVDGYVLNQFSMDEYNGYFRVVTYDTSREENKVNGLYIYDLNTLKIVGSIKENLGEGKQSVKSVSFNKDKCHVVTYEIKDPLYEIDLSDVTNPKIVSVYKAPGYSGYLKNFEINGESYLFGLGYLDDQCFTKISIYKETEEGSIQIGEDFVMSHIYVSNDVDLHLENFNYEEFLNHKALFIYQEEDKLYLGWKVEYEKYYIFEIDVNAEEKVTVYKTIDMKDRYENSRCYLIDGKLYITDAEELEIHNFN